MVDRDVKLSIPVRPEASGLGATVSCYLGSAALTLLFASGVFDQAFSLSGAFWDPFLWCGLAIAVALWATTRFGGDEVKLWSGLWLLFGVLAVANALHGWVEVESYGDRWFIGRWVADGHVLAKWLAGTAILGWLDIVLQDRIASELSNVGQARALIRLGAVAVMVGSSIALVRISRARLAILLPVLTPLWLLFSVGHEEYYPFVAPAFLAVLFWLFDRSLAERPAYQLGFVAALLFPLLYLGFAPHAAIVLLVSAAAMPRKSVHIFGAAFGTAVIGITVFFPKGVGTFLNQILSPATLNLGDHNTLHLPYVGQAAGPDSIFFSWQYALSPSHLYDVLYMLFFGAGAMAIPFLVAGLVACRRHLPRVPEWTRESRFWLGIGLLGWSIYYVVRMIPKIGPHADIDLFFASDLCLAFFAGLLCDSIPALRPGRALRVPIVAIALGSSSVGFARLAHHGISF